MFSEKTDVGEDMSYAIVHMSSARAANAVMAVVDAQGKGIQGYHLR